MTNQVTVTITEEYMNNKVLQRLEGSLGSERARSPEQVGVMLWK